MESLVLYTTSEMYYNTPMPSPFVLSCRTLTLGHEVANDLHYAGSDGSCGTAFQRTIWYGHCVCERVCLNRLLSHNKQKVRWPDEILRHNNYEEIASQLNPT